MVWSQSGGTFRYGKVSYIEWEETMQRIARAFLAGLALAALAGGAQAATTSRPAYGCFKVTAAEINIRAKPLSSAAVLGTAHKGDILVKRKRWCTLRGYWCAVRRGTTEGYADKSFMKVAPCPASMSKQ